jgi:hypothetical protein
MNRVSAAILGFAALCLASHVALAAETLSAAPLFPIPPCAGGPSPSYPEIGQTPQVRVWRDAEINGWQIPQCLGLHPINANTLLVAVGRFHIDGGMDEIAGRLAAISELTKVRYYAFDENWKNLYNDAYALADGTGDAKRPDFSAGDIQTSRMLRFWKEENSALGGIAYRLSIIERSDTRLAYTIVNESPAKAFLFNASEPGEFRQYYFVERDPDGGDWRYYSIVEARIGAGPFNVSSRSFQSRAIAHFRQIAGYPMEVAWFRAP